VSSLRSQLLRRKPADCVSLRGVADREMAAETGADAGQGFPAAVRADRRRSTWDEAVDDIAWSDGDILLVGSSSLKPVSRVFLGSRATKIVRHSPVPVVVVPRGRAEELAEDAAQSSTAAG
jgi:hypothetical protein